MAGTPYLTTHGTPGFLARRSRGVAVVVASVVVLALVVTVALVRTSAVRILDDAVGVHETGDCEPALELLDGLGPVRRAAHPDVAASADREAEACELLATAEDRSRQAAADRYADYIAHPRGRWEGAPAARGDALLGQAELDLADVSGPKDMRSAFDTLTVALDEDSDAGHPDRARQIVADFVDEAYSEPCRAVDDHHWIQAGDWDHPEITEPIAEKRDARDDVLLECAREHRRADELRAAAAAYREYGRDYPRERGAEAARRGLIAVVTEIERRRAASAVKNGTYCENPRAYRGAPAYRQSGYNRMIVFGVSPKKRDFPRSWHTRNVEKAALVVCVDGPKRGAYQRTCDYESFPGSFVGSPVRFYSTQFTVTAYSLRTGKSVARFTRQLGSPCPARITWWSSSPVSTPPDTYRSRPTSAEIRGMFEGLVG
ncbi:hypothetical protein [Myceligenerans pegani]|uniref:Uncharacterized protein n=1 Tax=Myceligenerans pegani TaxID=2776917 RepID=A0ABR9MUS9_9MICO|nr:hypothetical protein [Myceligenerans sp. TRM 65318]MBE1874761.1 hypothetical protein [Myceligenerans sp. TRM 65318]MBE3017032.1 hypothetical protein [Myceligenerans sp. TRM 65318]